MLTFRTAAEPDFEHVNRLARQVHELHVSLHPDLYRSVKHPISREEFREMVERDQLVVACRGEHIVAYAAFAVRDFDGASILPRRVMMLDALCVDGPCRRQGIAHAMLEELCRWAVRTCSWPVTAAIRRHWPFMKRRACSASSSSSAKSSDTKNQGASCALKSLAEFAARRRRIQ